jgi:hypothetical protein
MNPDQFSPISLYSHSVVRDYGLDGDCQHLTYIKECVLSKQLNILISSTNTFLSPLITEMFSSLSLIISPSYFKTPHSLVDTSSI